MDEWGKDRITEFLNRRHRERQSNLASLQELKNQEANEFEALEYFDQVFGTKSREIQKNLNNLQPGDRNQLTGTFNKILGSLQELQKYLSTSTIFLTEHKIKTCQAAINDLQAQVEEKRARLIPKKKFGFKSYTKPEVKEEDKEEARKDELDGVKRKEFQWTVAGLRNREILLDGELTNGQDVTISDLESCVVRIVGHPGSIQLSKLRNCVILAGPVARSVFADDCRQCKFAFACQQMRLHTSHACDIYLHVTCRAIIEDCTGIRTALYSWTYPGIRKDFASAALDLERNNWQDVADFNWLSPDRPSPNWKKMDEQGLIEDWPEFLQHFRRENAIHAVAE
ncbi:tubulin-specific chaperone C [Phlebotomus argentipes]|uniref:tubulin-specific chaperone C n=1 Tax=Phlebotomus argentipes TaxID=94469 RepID=UPI0028934C46|nr:tubulin-specific chaperone C [Phlebotomus argentipes]